MEVKGEGGTLWGVVTSEVRGEGGTLWGVITLEVKGEGGTLWGVVTSEVRGGDGFLSMGVAFSMHSSGGGDTLSAVGVSVLVA